MKKGQQEGNEIKNTVENHKDARASEIAQVITGIGNVDYLTANELVSISRKLYELVSFCDCVGIENIEAKNHRRFDEVAYHNCDKFNHHDHEHLPYCKCCQTGTVN